MQSTGLVARTFLHSQIHFFFSCRNFRLFTRLSGGEARIYRRIGSIYSRYFEVQMDRPKPDVLNVSGNSTARVDAQHGKVSVLLESEWNNAAKISGSWRRREILNEGALNRHHKLNPPTLNGQRYVPALSTRLALDPRVMVHLSYSQPCRHTCSKRRTGVIIGRIAQLAPEA